MNRFMLTGVLLGTAMLCACGGGSEANETSAPEATSPGGTSEGSSVPEIPTQDEIDQEAAEQIDGSNADEEYRKLVEEMEKEG